METNDNEVLFLDILIKETMTKYRLIILSQKTLACVSHSHPAIQTIVKKYPIYSSIENFYYSTKSTTENKTSTENLKKIWPTRNYNIIITNGIKKALEIPQNELKKPNKKQTDKVKPFISTFNPNNPPAYNAIKNSI